MRPARLDPRVGRPLGAMAAHHSRSILRPLQSEPAHNLRNDILHRTTHVHDDWILVGVWLLQDREVTVEDVGQHGMLFAGGQALLDQRPLAVQINEAHLWSATGQEVAITALERRAGDDAARAEPATTVDPCRHLGEPGPLIAVIERMDGVHLGERRRMEFVTFLQRPSELLGEGGCYCRLPAARDACDNEDCRRVKGRRKHGLGRPFRRDVRK